MGRKKGNPPYSFRIFITHNKKKLKNATWYNVTGEYYKTTRRSNGKESPNRAKHIRKLENAIGYYKIFVEKSSEVFFPKKWYINKGIIEKYNLELVLCTKLKDIDTNNIPGWMIDGARDNLGKQVKLVSDNQQWNILHKSSYQEEEKMYVWSNFKKKLIIRKEYKLKEIINDFLLYDDSAKYVSLFKDKVLITNNKDKSTIIITKVVSETHRLVSYIKKFLSDTKSTIPIVFLGTLNKENSLIAWECFVKWCKSYTWWTTANYRSG